MGNDTRVEKQNIVLGFTYENTYEPQKYVFEMDDRQDKDQTTLGVVRIRKYPAPPPGLQGGFVEDRVFDAIDNDIQMSVTEGRLEITRETREREISGTVVVTGDTDIELPHPVVSGLSYSIDGWAYDRKGEVVDPNIGFSSYKNALVLSRVCYCKVRYRFITTYQILRYHPNIYNDFEAYYMPDPSDYGQLMGFIRPTLGMQIPDPIIFAISPPESIEAEFELYRVESTGIVLETGIWERPMGWPKDGSYVATTGNTNPNGGGSNPTGATESLDINASNIEIARTHEIGYFSLLNNPRRLDLHRSATSDTLPLDFTKELRFSDSAGSTVAAGTAYSVKQSDGSSVSRVLSQTQKVQGAEYFEKYKRLLNKAPKMRTVHYDIPIGHPYNSTSAVNEAREVVRNISSMLIRGPHGEVDKETEDRQKVITETLKEFRIVVTVKAPSRPKISTAVLRDRSNADSVDFNIQAQRINTMLSLIWEGVDWPSLCKRISAAYDPAVYKVVFDSSIPGHEAITTGGNNTGGNNTGGGTTTSSGGKTGTFTPTPVFNY